MSSFFDLHQKRKEEARWRILRVLDAGRPIGASEHIIWQVLNGVKIPFSPNELRRELDYLRECELIEIDGEDTGTWYAKLTRAGIDVVEYTVPVQPGIARPPK